MRLAQKLWHYRHEHSLEQKEMAGLLSISREYYAQLERGACSPSVSLANRVAELLNIAIIIVLPSSDPEIRKLIEESNQNGDGVWI